MPILAVENIHAYYGHIHALRNVSLAVEKGEIVTLIGGNGAGKSTTLNTISGLLRPRQGSVRFEGEELTKYPPHEIVGKGVVQVPEGRRIFGRLTVLENLEMGAFSVNNPKLIHANLKKVFSLFPRLEERSRQVAGTLSGGEQQMAAIGRGLMSRPRLLMLDEPSWGLAPMLVSTIFEIIRKINASGVSVLLVEQNVFHALNLSHRAYVLENGEMAMSGASAALLKDPHICRTYLGL